MQVGIRSQDNFKSKGTLVDAKVCSPGRAGRTRADDVAQCGLASLAGVGVRDKRYEIFAGEPQKESQGNQAMARIEQEIWRDCGN